MRFKKGDTVYALGLNDKVFKATIKCVHRSNKDLPYELDITARNRFYPEDAVFATQEEATAGLNASIGERMRDAIENGKEFKLSRTTEPDKDGVLRDPNGKKITKYFKLTKAQRAKLEELCGALDEYMSQNNIPYMLTVVAESTKENDGCKILARNSSCFPGPRCPVWLNALWDIQNELMYGSQEG